MGQKNDGEKKSFSKTMTKKAIKANRQNAKKSTGPKIQRDPKAFQPNTKHGILASIPVLPFIESQEEWDGFLQEMKNDLHPQGVLETHLVEKLANIAWRQRRLLSFESSILGSQIKHEKLEKSNVGRSFNEFIYNIKEDFNSLDNTRLDDLYKQKSNYDIYRALLSTLILSSDDTKYTNAQAFAIFKFILEIDYLAKKDAKDADLPKTPLDLYGLREFLDTLSIQGEMTKSEIMDKLKFIAEKSNIGINQVVADAIAVTKSLPPNLDKIIRRREEEVDYYLKKLIFDNPDNEKINKMEVHLNRLFTQTLHELQRLQAMRIGISGPPKAIDITGLE